MKNVLHSFNYSLDFLGEQLADVGEADMVALPDGTTNHPAWTVGHITFVIDMIGSVIGVPNALPESWAKRFGPGSVAEAETDLYEGKEVALRMLGESRNRLVDAVSNLSDAHLDKPFPDQTYLEVFPTVRHALTQVLVGHTAFHVGQLSVWRKAMGLPSIGRSYE